MRTIHIVITDDSCVDIEVLAEMAAHAFAEKLFPTVSILGHGGISIGLLECDHIRNRLFACCINACRRGKEEAVQFVLLCSHQKVRVDQYGQHAIRLVGLDVTHAAHVRSVVVDPCRPREG